MRFDSVFIGQSLLCAVFLVAIGCERGPDLVPVSGQVLIDGQPLTAGYIQVMPANERAASGQIDSSGRFTLSTYEEGDGCLRGTHKVAIMASRQLSPTRTEHLIPPKYNDPAAGLMAIIDGPTDKLEIQLSWDGGKPYIEQILTGGDVAPIGTE